MTINGPRENEFSDSTLRLMRVLSVVGISFLGVRVKAHRIRNPRHFAQSEARNVLESTLSVEDLLDSIGRWLLILKVVWRTLLAP